MVDPPPGGIAQWSPDGSAMPLRGVLEGGSTINLVPSHTTHGTAQILSAVIGGLVFATVATLFFVPAVFAIIHGRSGAPHPAQPSGKTHD